MSRREAVLKATAGALQAKSLDLTQFRQQSTRDPRRLKLRGEDAAGALAFVGMDMHIEGQRFVGDRLAPLLLRLKYANQCSRETFQRAHALLFHHHGGRNNKRSEVVWALAQVALFEWLNDSCPKCRTRKRVAKPGMRCLHCGSSGRVSLQAKQRFRLVNGYLRDAKRTGRAVEPLGMDNFISHWLPRYLYLLDALRVADRALAAHIDIGIFTSRMRVTVPDPRGPSSGGAADQEEDERGPEGPANGPREPYGVVPPQES